MRCDLCHSANQYSSTSLSAERSFRLNLVECHPVSRRREESIVSRSWIRLGCGRESHEACRVDIEEWQNGARRQEKRKGRGMRPRRPAPCGTHHIPRRRHYMPRRRLGSGGTSEGAGTAARQCPARQWARPAARLCRGISRETLPASRVGRGTRMAAPVNCAARQVACRGAAAAARRREWPGPMSSPCETALSLMLRLILWFVGIRDSQLMW